MFREFGFAFCVSKVFPMFFESCVEVYVGWISQSVWREKKIVLINIIYDDKLSRDAIAINNISRNNEVAV